MQQDNKARFLLTFNWCPFNFLALRLGNSQNLNGQQSLMFLKRPLHFKQL